MWSLCVVGWCLLFVVDVRCSWLSVVVSFVPLFVVGCIVCLVVVCWWFLVVFVCCVLCDVVCLFVVV